MDDNSRVLFFNDDTKYRLKNKKAIRLLIKTIFSDFGYKLSFLNYIFCTDELLYKVNLQFLKHDSLTDIITFDYTEGKEIKGEAYISLDRVRDDAKNLKTAFYNELLRVIFHGALHLVGFDDQSQYEKNEMRKKEDYYLARFFASSKASS